MNFGSLLEHHKIPEWYTEYLSYKELSEEIAEFKISIKHQKQ